MFRRGKQKKPFLTGLVSGGEGQKDGDSNLIGVFGWHNEDGSFTCIKEANVRLDLSSHPELHRDLAVSDVEEMLVSLVTTLGEAFRQKRIYVFRTVVPLSIFQQEGSRTPTQQD